MKLKERFQKVVIWVQLPLQKADEREMSLEREETIDLLEGHIATALVILKNDVSL